MKLRSALLALPLLAGCQSITDADTALGIIQSQYLRSPVIEAPTVVSAGQTFHVTVRTLGYSGCWRAADTKVAATASSATVRPFDEVVGGACTAALVNIPHTVELRFDTPGTAKIVAEGRRDPYEFDGSVITIEQTVTVQ